MEPEPEPGHIVLSNIRYPARNFNVTTNVMHSCDDTEQIYVKPPGVLIYSACHQFVIGIAEIRDGRLTVVPHPTLFRMEASSYYEEAFGCETYEVLLQLAIIPATPYEYPWNRYGYTSLAQASSSWEAYHYLEELCLV